MPKKKTKEAPKQPPYELHTLFPTNVLTRDWVNKDVLNNTLKQEIWRKRALDPEGLYRSNLAGTWHSNDYLLTETGEAGEHLRGMFAQAFIEWAGTHGFKPEDETKLTMNAWAMIYSDRGYAAVHTHPNCHASAVYYVDDTTPETEITMATGVRLRAGDIEFINPGYRDFQLKGIALNPSAIMSFKAGRMLIFPSNLAHYVHPIRGEGERIAIACNCTFHPVSKEKK